MHSSLEAISLMGFSRGIKKEMDCVIIFGGPHPTFFPELISNSYVDIICRGEGEYR